MADRQERLGIIVYVEDQATGKLQRVKAEVAGMGPAGAVAGRGLTTGAASIEKSAGRIGGALSHAKGAIGGLLTGPLGLLGLGAGLFTVGGALTAGFTKAQTWGLQIEKLQGITHDSAESLSGLLAVTEKYGLSNERLSQIAGFTEKSLGNLTKGVNDAGQAAQNAKKFQDNYGFSILDSAGKTKTFSTLLLTFSDYWVKEKDRAIAAAAAAKLFGRGYADLVPILNLGSKGIKEAEEEARALGLTLTQNNIVALAKAREATRQWGDALGGLELQLGLALLPQLTKLAGWATSFVSTHGHEIVKFFTDAADFAGKAAGTIGDLVGAASAFWGSIPAPLRDLILKGIVADRTIHFLFGFSPIEAVGGTLLKGLTGQIFQRGSSPANPLFVSDIAKGLGVPGAAGGGGAAGTLFGVPLATLATFAGLALIVPAVALLTMALVEGRPKTEHEQNVSDAINAGRPIAPHGSGPLRPGSIPTSFKHPPSDAPWRDHMPVADPGPIWRDHGLAEIRLADAIARNTATLERADWLKKLEASWQKAGQTMHDRIKSAMADLAAGKNVHGVAGFLGGKLGNAGFGAGGYDLAVKAIAQLKNLHTTDPSVVTAIHQLEARLPRLKTDKADLAAAITIANSHDPKNVKLDKLAALERDIAVHGDPTTHKKLSDIINTVKHQKPPVVTVHTHVLVPLTINNVDANGRSHTTARELVVQQRSMYDQRQFKAKGGRLDPRVPTVVGEEGPELIVDGYVYDARKTAPLIAGRGGRGAASQPHGERGLERALAVTVNNRISPVGLHRATTTHRIFNAGAGEAISV